MDKPGNFDRKVARAMGVSCGIVLLELKNDMEFVTMGLGGKVVDNRPWILASGRVLEEKHPYLTPDKIKNTIKKLLDHEMIVTRNDINDDHSNRSRWISVNKEEEWIIL